MSPQRHVILRQTLELSIANRDDAWTLQQEASRILRQAQPQMERCCDALSSPDRLHRIERLELDLGTLNPNHLEEDLLSKFGEALRRGLAEQIDQQESTGLSPVLASQLELFSQFVKLGSLPWWADISRPDLPQESLDRLLREAPELLLQRLPELAREPLALRRLSGHFDDRSLAALVLLQAPALADFPLALFEALLFLPEFLPALAATPSAQFRSHLWQSLLGNAALSAQPPADRLNFSREVAMRLAHLQAVPYQALAQAFAQAAAAGRFQGAASEIAAALEAESEGRPRPLQTQRLAEMPHREPATPLWGGKTGEAALAELRLWLDQGIQGPAPAWLQSWPPTLREALFSRLQDLSNIGEGIASALAELRRWLESGGTQDAEPPWLQSWPALLREEFAAQLWDIGKQQAAIAQPQRHREAAQTVADFSDADEIYLSNAGLVILWPFLASFFGRLGLLAENRFSDEAARQRGVALLQYLACEDAAPPEYHLPLNKLLCGMALEAVFELDPPLDDTEIAECDGLLAAVIAQAPILNNMSIPGFRGSFLLRAGMLSIRDGGWLLRVERETYDLVLDQFPWGFAWIKLPWMEAPLQVEW